MVFKLIFNKNVINILLLLSAWFENVVQSTVNYPGIRYLFHFSLIKFSVFDLGVKWLGGIA